MRWCGSGGDKIVEVQWLLDYLAANYDLLIGKATAEYTILKLDSKPESSNNTGETITLFGKNTRTGNPLGAKIPIRELREARSRFENAKTPKREASRGSILRL